jgi:hypothetical protein
MAGTLLTSLAATALILCSSEGTCDDRRARRCVAGYNVCAFCRCGPGQIRRHYLTPAGETLQLILGPSSFCSTLVRSACLSASDRTSGIEMWAYNPANSPPLRSLRPSNAWPFIVMVLSFICASIMATYCSFVMGPAQHFPVRSGAPLRPARLPAECPQVQLACAAG